MNSCTYVLCAEGSDDCVLVDCGEYEPLHDYLDSNTMSVKAILLTHGHCDHIAGLPLLLKDFPDIPIYTTKEGVKEVQDARMNLSFFTGNPVEVESFKAVEVGEGSSIEMGGFPAIKVLYTPGHDNSELSYIVDNALFSGDAYIPGIEVLYKYPRGNKEDAFKSEARLKELEHQGYKVYCGHHSY